MEENQYPPINEKIKTRRLELGLRDVELAQRTGLSIYQYGDLEDYPDYIFLVAPLYYVKKVCGVLRVNLLSLFGMHCAFCEDHIPYLEDYRSWRCTLAKT
jgi:hypothetical protein